MLKVQKKARPRGSSCWQLTGCVAARAAAALKASRPLNCVLVINDNYKWTNCFIEVYESRMVHR
jgi:hypothetical protein